MVMENYSFQSPPFLGEKISRILKDECNAEKALMERLKNAERSFFNSPETQSESWCWNVESLSNIFQEIGFEAVFTELDQKEERFITDRDLNIWFNKDNSIWASYIFEKLGEEDFFKVKNLLESRIKQGPILWLWKTILFNLRLYERFNPLML